MKILENHIIKNSLKIKSVSSYYIEIDNLTCFNKLHDFINIKDLPVIILGEGTNIVPPNLFNGIAVKPSFTKIDFKDNFVEVGASVNWDFFANHMINKNLNGFENLSLIPGSVGAAPIQNIGAYGQEVSNLIEEVHCYDYKKNIFIKLTNEQCNFSYRDSLLKNTNLIIYKVVFRINNSNKLNLNYHSIQSYIDDNKIDKDSLNQKLLSNIICKIRNKNLPDPNIIPNAGSFFKNPILKENDIKIDNLSINDLVIWKLDKTYSKIGAARLIDLIKNKLNINENVFIYDKHSLVLITNSKASQNDILDFACQIQDIVFDTFNITLEIEPTVIIN